MDFRMANTFAASLDETRLRLASHLGDELMQVFKVS